MNETRSLQAEIEILHAKLAESEEMLRAISMGQVDALIVKDQIHLLRGSAHPYRIIKEEVLPGFVVTEDGTLLFHNRLFSKLVGLSRHSGLDSIRRVVAPQDQDIFQIALAAGLSAERHERLALASPDGTVVPADLVFYPVAINGVTGCCVVATAAGETESSALGESRSEVQPDSSIDMDELRYRMLADFVPHVVWTARPDGYRDYFNRRWYELTGLTLEKSQGLGWVDAVEPSERAATLEHWAQSAQSGKDYEREVRFRSAPGVYRWHMVRAVPVKDRSGRILKWFGICTDIEEQRIARDEATRGRQKIEEMARELARSNEALTQFASVASHDLQEPLHKISSYADLLASADKFGDREKKFLKHIQTATHRMNRLIHDVLTYAKVSGGAAHREDVPLTPVVQQVLEDLETRVREKGAQVSIAELPTVSASHSQMRQLFQNIISNALKYSKPGTPPRIDINCRPVAENVVEISVRDNGIGFDNAAGERIFHPFERLHGRSEYEGSGLGLAVCRRIAEAHGGTIAAESQLGVGSNFRIILPLRPRA